MQCIEVDEACSALKINDGETMVWCFVTKQGMHKVGMARGQHLRMCIS